MAAAGAAYKSLAIRPANLCFYHGAPPCSPRKTLSYGCGLSLIYAAPGMRNKPAEPDYQAWSCAGLARNGHQSLSVQVVGRTLQTAEQIHLLEPAIQQTVFEFAAGIDGVLELAA